MNTATNVKMTRPEAYRLLDLGGRGGGALDEKAITKAYRKSARTTHPDKPGGSKDKFVKVLAAYEFLKTDVKNKATVAARAAQAD